MAGIDKPRSFRFRRGATSSGDCKPLTERTDPRWARSCAIPGASEVGSVIFRVRPMSKTVKHSVAVLIRNEDRILTVRRPDDEAELPGIWGLPAGTYRGSESLPDLVHRIGKEKLGVLLLPLRKIAEGLQERAQYQLRMELWEARMEGEPKHVAWRWAALSALEDGRSRGSLCCELALRAGPSRS